MIVDDEIVAEGVKFHQVVKEKFIEGNSFFI